VTRIKHVKNAIVSDGIVI